jgi:multicomponent Na+:H+ antiporter subunit B
MNSIILQTVARFFMPIQGFFSVFLLLRGHNDPGGGFAGGLVLAVAFALHAIAYSPNETRRLLRIDPLVLAGTGLLLALVAGFIGLAVGDEFLNGQWIDGYILGIKFGTPLLFDVGVYLLVVGMAVGLLLSMMGER